MIFLQTGPYIDVRLGERDCQGIIQVKQKGMMKGDIRI